MRELLRGLSSSLVIGIAGAGPLAAQAADSTATPVIAPACTDLSGPQFAVCQAAHDAVFAALPAASLLIGAGNPKLGTASANGKFGSITLTLRATHAVTVLPSSTYDGVSDTIRTVRRHAATLPSVDLAFGLFQKAMPTGTVGVEFLGSVFLIDPDGTPSVSFPDDTRRLGKYVVGFGWGMRFGLTPKGPLPFASLSVTKRDLPHYTFGDIPAGSTYSYTLGISAINVRLMAGKRFGKFEFTMGAGADLLKGTYSVRYTDPETAELKPQVDSTRSAMRIITAANASLDLKPVRVTFEGGYQVGKDEKLPTIVKTVDPRSGRFFAGVGLALRF